MSVELKSMLDAYLQAAYLAVMLRVSLAHAYNHYVKPDLPPGLPLMTDEQISTVVQIQEAAFSLKPSTIPLELPKVAEAT